MQDYNCNPSKLAYLYPILFFCALSTFARAWVPAFYSAWPVLLFGCVLSVILARSYFTTKNFGWILIYSAIVMSNYFFGDEYFDTISIPVNEFVDLYLLTITTYYFFESDTPKQAGFCEIGIYALIVVAAVGSIMVDAIFPGVVREANSWQDGENVNNFLLPSYYKMGMSNYLLPHGLPVIIPPLFYLICQNSKGRRWHLFYIVILILTLVLIYLSGSTTVLVLSLFAILFSVVIRHYGFNKPGLLLLLSFPLIIILIFPDLIGAVASLFGGNDVSSVYSSHLIDAEDYLQGRTEGNTSSRLKLYKDSFASFFSSPIWGISSDEFGGHSAIIDRLATLGLVGFIPFVMVFKSQFQYVKSKLSSEAYPYYLLSFAVGIVMLAMKNMFQIDILIMLFLMAPLMLYRR